MSTLDATLGTIVRAVCASAMDLGRNGTPFAECLAHPHHCGPKYRTRYLGQRVERWKLGLLPVVGGERSRTCGVRTIRGVRRLRGRAALG
jgi:hypothetical protein